jgi:hypothetical protein
MVAQQSCEERENMSGKADYVAVGLVVWSVVLEFLTEGLRVVLGLVSSPLAPAPPTSADGDYISIRSPLFLIMVPRPELFPQLISTLKISSSGIFDLRIIPSTKRSK